MVISNPTSADDALSLTSNLHIKWKELVAAIRSAHLRGGASSSSHDNSYISIISDTSQESESEFLFSNQSSFNAGPSTNKHGGHDSNLPHHVRERGPGIGVSPEHLQALRKVTESFVDRVPPGLRATSHPPQDSPVDSPYNSNFSSFSNLVTFNFHSASLGDDDAFSFTSQAFSPQAQTQMLSPFSMYAQQHSKPGERPRTFSAAEGSPEKSFSSSTSSHPSLKSAGTYGSVHTASAITSRASSVGTVGPTAKWMVAASDALTSMRSAGRGGRMSPNESAASSAFSSFSEPYTHVEPGQ